MLIGAFMSLTQKKITDSMTARSFLENVPALPLPATENFFLTCVSFALLSLFSVMYSRSDSSELSRYLLVALEIGACILLMRSLNLAYDGVVLLVVADLMRRYEGKNQEYILLFAMIGLYFIANYNLAVLKTTVVPFDAYTAYYKLSAQTVIIASKNIFVSLNIVFFVLYMVMLVKSKHEEKERISLLNAQLESANERLRNYAVQASRMAETRERNRLAREIHDTLGHALTGIAAGLDACILTVDAAPAFTKMQLEKIRHTALNGITDVRRSVKKLRPDALEKLPLRAALSRMTDDFAESSGMEVFFDIEGNMSNLREDQEDVIYRVVQESLTNANRHGHAKHAQVTICAEDGRLRIITADDGTGCDDVKPGFGLQHMRERLELLHGTLDFWSDAGFIIEASIPINKPEE